MSRASIGRIVSIETKEAFDRTVREVSGLLAKGEIVALPTETVYGLAANAYSSEAVERIFAVKGRPANNPVIVHFAGLDMAKSCVAEWPEAAERLGKAFWPGPLTLVLRRSTVIPDVVTAGGPTVGIRWPSHPFIQAVIETCGFPLAAPSANLSNSLSPTCPEHVRAGLGGAVPLIVDGGSSRVGIESAVVDLTVDPPRVLRPGMIDVAALSKVAGRIVSGAAEIEGYLRSPGQLRKHYSPKAKLIVRSWENAADLERQIRSERITPSKCRVIAHTVFPTESQFGGVSILPADAEAYARAIYAELHRCDTPDAALIVVERIPEGLEWQGVRDRITRAASPKEVADDAANKAAICGTGKVL